MTQSANRSADDTWSCNCIGPQNGEPLCPCQMRGLVQRDGRWVRPEKDMGPVRSETAKRFVAEFRNWSDRL